MDDMKDHSKSAMMEALVFTSGIVCLTSLVGLYLLRKRRSSPSTADQGLETPSKKVKSAASDVAANPTIGVFYGTQTGTAEQYALDLSKKLKENFQVDVVIKDLEELGDDVDGAPQRFTKPDMCLVLCSTYGDGEPPDTAMKFFDWLKEQADESEDMNEAMKPLYGCKYAVFGLGNTQYEHFNKSGKVLDQYLHLCGGERAMKIGLGDDDDSIEEDFNKWTEAALELLKESGVVGKGSSITASAEGTPAAVPAFKVTVQKGTTKPFPYVNARKSYDAAHPFKATLAQRRELQSAGSDRSTLHVEVDIAGSGMTYQTGDHLGVYAENAEQVVTSLAWRLQVNLDDVITVEEDPVSGAGRGRSIDGSAKLSLNPLGHLGPMTVRMALARYCDVLTPPKKSALAAMAAYASSLKDAKRLQHLASKEGKDEYNSWILGDYRSVLEVLEAFPSCAPPLGAFFCSIAPRLQVRYYSISSSPLAAPTTPSLTVAVVDGKTGTGRHHRGVASHWLSRLDVGQKLQAPVFIRHSTFRLPKSASTPIIMIGPGTGLAPFRGFWQERKALKDQGQALGEALLFFGCRNMKCDYIYQEEMAEALAQGVISDLRVAFSRDGPNKTYVQHLLKEQGSAVMRLLNSGAHLYVCGDAKHMARDVNKTLAEILQEEGGLTASETEAMIKSWQDTGRYSRDVW